MHTERKALNTTGAHSETIRARVLQRGNVRFCAPATAKSIDTLICRLSIARILVQVFRTRMTNATTYRYLTQSFILPALCINVHAYITIKCARMRHHVPPPTDPPGLPIPYDISKPVISRNNLHHTFPCIGS